MVSNTEMDVVPKTDCSVPMPTRFIPTYDTDFILLVTTRPIPSSSPGMKTLAYATTCQTCVFAVQFDSEFLSLRVVILSLSQRMLLKTSCFQLIADCLSIFSSHRVQ